jgi:hypothetical protein
MEESCSKAKKKEDKRRRRRKAELTPLFYLRPFVTLTRRKGRFPHTHTHTERERERCVKMRKLLWMWIRTQKREGDGRDWERVGEKRSSFTTYHHTQHLPSHAAPSHTNSHTLTYIH